jgi:hypothetical protein
MLSSKKKLQVGGAFATLLAFALGVGCHGFFVNPTLTGMTVGPTTTINTGGSVQMTAVGTFSDGSTQTLGSGVYWSSADTSVATVSSSGLVKGISSGTASITGSYQTQSGSATITVQLSNISSISVTPMGASCPSGGSQQFTAMAATPSGQVNITDSATWSSSNPNAGSMDSSTGFFTCASVTAITTTVITAAENGVVSPNDSFSVTP